MLGLGPVRLSMHHTSLYIQHAWSLHVQLALESLARKALERSPAFALLHRYLHLVRQLQLAAGGSRGPRSITKSSACAMNPYPKAGGPAPIDAGSCSALRAGAAFSGLMLVATDCPPAMAGGRPSSLPRAPQLLAGALRLLSSSSANRWHLESWIL